MRISIDVIKNDQTGLYNIVSHAATGAGFDHGTIHPDMTYSEAVAKMEKAHRAAYTAIVEEDGQSD